MKQYAISQLIARGASEKEAKIVAEDYLDADLRGRSSHGFVSFAVALSAFPHAGHYQVQEHQGSVLSIEGNGDCGHVVAREAIDLALPHLSQQKVYAIGIREMTRFNCPGAIARYGAQAGAITIVLEYGGKNFMAPYGGIEATLSTNPIGIGIPGTDPLFVLDIATSERAIGYVELAKLAQESIPETWGIDEQGKPTTDPAQVRAMKPFGGYKGYALSAAFEILSGALVRVGIGQDGNLVSRGAFILLLDPTIFGHTMTSFSEQVMKFLTEMKSVTPTGALQVNYPGELSEERYRQCLEAGQIWLPDEVVKELEAIPSAS